MDALELESATPTTLGGVGPLGFYFITLQSTDNTGPASTGSMTINFGPNTFTSSLDVFFDVHFGALNGPIVYASDLVLSSASTAWGNVAPGDALLINGVDNLLNGTTTANDFWPAGTYSQTSASLTQDVAAASAVPEPSPM
jgi:hypothetical protein